VASSKDAPANVTWDACWAKGQATQGGPPANCKPVPGAGGLAPSTTQPVQVKVRDIQSVAIDPRDDDRVVEAVRRAAAACT